MKLTFEPISHKYYLDGQEIPGVSELLTLTGYLQPQYYNATSHKMARGTLVHLLIHEHETIGIPTLDDEMGPWLEAYFTFKLLNKFRCLASEARGYNVDPVFAGTADLVGKIGPAKYVVDLKTGTKASWHRLQVAAYAIIHNVSHAGILYLRESKKGIVPKFEVIRDLDQAKAEFLTIAKRAVDTWQYNKQEVYT